MAHQGSGGWREMQRATPARSVALDAFRGAVILLLVPDVLGGLSLYRLAANFPESTLINSLARQLTHAQWSGCTVWDLVMPFFLFAAGMSIAYSRSARLQDPMVRRAGLRHVILRSVALLTLGLLLQFRVQSYFDLAWPMLLVALGLPWRRWFAALLSNDSRFTSSDAEFLLWLVILTGALLRIATEADRAYLSFHDILPQLGLAYTFAYVLAGVPRPARTLTAIGILVGYWTLFALYPLPPPELDLASVGIAPGDEQFVGFLAHWNKGTNVAAMFDREFLNLMPRAERYSNNAHGYQTLNFIPSIVSLLIGTTVGELLRSNVSPAAIRRKLLLAGLAAIGGGWVLGQTVCPIVKSIWTPSWVLFSSGWALLVFAGFHLALESGSTIRWTFLLVIVGANPLSLYVLALYYRPWILGVWQRVLPLGPLTDGWQPLLAAGLMTMSLSLLAFVMHRLKLTIRL